MPKATTASALARPSHPAPLSAGERKARLARRDAWLAEIDPAHLFFPLFDLLSDVSFFAKNRAGELMLMSRSNRNVYRIDDDAQVIGLTDFDLNPSEMAASYVADDARIFATGKPVLKRVELWFDEGGIPDWFLVNKLPIIARNGSVVGVMGIAQSYAGRARLLEPFDGLAKAVSRIKHGYGDHVSLEEVARLAGMSIRQLQRKFKQAFGVGPHDYLIQTRLIAACHAIRDTDQTLGEIAFACGFCDQSAFTRYFREHMGLTPRNYRLQVRRDAEVPPAAAP